VVNSFLPLLRAGLAFSFKDCIQFFYSLAAISSIIRTFQTVDKKADAETFILGKGLFMRIISNITDGLHRGLIGPRRAESLFQMEQGRAPCFDRVISQGGHSRSPPSVKFDADIAISRILGAHRSTRPRPWARRVIGARCPPGALIPLPGGRRFPHCHIGSSLSGWGLDERPDTFRDRRGEPRFRRKDGRYDQR